MFLRALANLTDGTVLFLTIALFAFGAWSSLVLWPQLFEASGRKQLSLQVFEEAANADLSAEVAHYRLKEERSVQSVDTRRSTAPFWLLVSISHSSGNSSIVEIPSRSTRDIACWNAEGYKVIGYGNRERTSGKVFRLGSGFAVRFDDTTTSLVCKLSFAGPAQLTAIQREDDDIADVEGDFARQSGLVDGALLAMSMLMFAAAVATRDRTFAIFGVWMILNARVAAISIGTDIQFLGYTIPDEYILQLRQVTKALFSLASIAVASILLRPDFILLGVDKWLPYLQVPSLVSLVLAILLSYENYLPFLWANTLWITCVMLWTTASIVTYSRSKAAVLLSLAAAVALSSGLVGAVASLTWNSPHDFYGNTLAGVLSSVICILSVAEYFRLEQSQRHRIHERMVKSFMTTPAALFSMDLDGIIRAANPAFRRALGITELDDTNNKWTHHFSADSLADLFSSVQSNSSSEQFFLPHGGSLPEQRKKYFAVRARLDGGMLEGCIDDVTDHANEYHLYRHQAMHDPVTECLNLRGTEQVYASALAQVAEGKGCVLAYVTFEGFHALRDLHGPAVANDLLRQISREMASAVGSGVSYGRVGLSDFAIVMPDTNISIGRQICEVVSITLSKVVFPVKTRRFSVSPVIGVVEITSHCTWMNALDLARQACNRAQSSDTRFLVVGRGTAADADQAELERIAQMLAYRALPSDLHFAIQPIIGAASSQEPFGCELVLCRRKLNRKSIHAQIVIDAATAFGYSGYLDKWIVDRSVRWIAENYRLLQEVPFIAVEIRPTSLRDSAFIEATEVALASHRYAASAICFNVPAASALQDLHAIQQFIAMVSAYGARCFLTDFGVGAVDLAKLAHVPASGVRLGARVLNDFNLLNGLVSVATNYGMLVIADGVPDRATAFMLADMRVRYCQGESLAPIVSAEEFLAPEGAKRLQGRSSSQ